jgi:lipoic acid synthetase
MLESFSLATVCAEARCPNRDECWSRHTATFLVMGAVCTRNCSFCSVASGTPPALDPTEPARISGAVKQMGLLHAVITSVTRDDLPDGGAGHLASCIRAVRGGNPGTAVEVLAPDFSGNGGDIHTVLDASPAVFGHNLETVERLSPGLRSGAEYRRSLAVLATAAQYGGIPVKSGLMLGLGEEADEIRASLADLLQAGVSLLTLGQYLRPSTGQVPVARFVSPAEFDSWKKEALAMGFQGVASSPFTRSSHLAAELLAEATHGKK